MASPIVRVEGVSKAFSLAGQGARSLKEALVSRLKGRQDTRPTSFTALKDISFTVERGDFFGVIGTNGSGKSTLLKLVAGISRPSRGTVAVDGRVSALLELGAGFHSDFTGRENVFMYGTVLGLDKQVIRERFDAIVDFAELWDFIDQPVRTYSSGMYMRLAFAIAVNVDPELLIIDEILAVGDANFQKKCFERIDAFREAGKTILFVSHDHGTVEKYCNKVLWLDRGVARACGEARAVVSAYMEHLAEKESDRHAESARALENRSRWGDGACKITGVRLVTPEGDEKYTWRTGADVVLAIAYEAQVPIPDPAVGFGVFRSDGLQCYGSNTDIDGVSLGILGPGSGEIRVRFPDLALLPGTYALDIAIHERGNGYRPYDYMQRCVAFGVTDTRPDAGVMRLPHTWERVDGLPSHGLVASDEVR